MLVFIVRHYPWWIFSLILLRSTDFFITFSPVPFVRRLSESRIRFRKHFYSNKFWFIIPIFFRSLFAMFFFERSFDGLVTKLWNVRSFKALRLVKTASGKALRNSIRLKVLITLWHILRATRFRLSTKFLCAFLLEISLQIASVYNKGGRTSKVIKIQISPCWRMSQLCLSV